MYKIHHFFETLFSADKLIQNGRLTLMLIIVFAEKRLFFEFFGIGVFLLYAAGLLYGTNHPNLFIALLTLSVMAAVIPAYFSGYASGRIFGNKLFKKNDSHFFKKECVGKTELVFSKFENAFLVTGRRFSVVTAFTSVLANITKMNFMKFTVANFSVGKLWIMLLISTIYHVGKNHPEVFDFISCIVAGIIILTAISVFKTKWSELKLKGL